MDTHDEEEPEPGSSSDLIDVKTENKMPRGLSLIVARPAALRWQIRSSEMPMPLTRVQKLLQAQLYLLRRAAPRQGL